MRLGDDDRMLERSQRSKLEFEKKKEVLNSSNEEMGHDDLITDITELFLSGEEFFRNSESVGSSSKSLTTLFWNLGN